MDRALDLVQLRLEESKVSLLGMPTVTGPWADEGQHPSIDTSSALRWCASS